MADYTTNPASDISDSDVAKMCSEILEWHKTGTLPKNSTFKKFANEAHLEMRDAGTVIECAKYILSENLLTKEDVENS